MNEKRRSAYWDNVKVLLIFLVVLGHYFGYGFVYGDLSGGRWLIPNGIYGFVYMFHMPLFAFVSGFFSKNTEKCCKRAVGEYLIPYLAFNTLCVGMNRLLLGVPLVNPVTNPYNHMWYLFALFFWRLTAKWGNRLPHSWIWAGALAAVLSLTPVMEWELTSRMFLFWPFFLLGLQMEQPQVLRVKKLPHWLCGGVLVGMLLLSVLILKQFDCSTYRLCFLGRRFGVNRAGIVGLMKLLLRYVTALVLGGCVLNLVPSRGMRITLLGKNTMSIYLLHSLPKLRNTMNALNPMMGSQGFCLIYYTLWTLGAMAVFGNPYVSHVINWVLGIPGKVHKKFSILR